MGRISGNTNLGDSASFCVDCGWARRYMPGIVEPPAECPACGGSVLSACPGCDAPIGSIMAVECHACGSALRDPHASGAVRIRRGGRRIEVVDPPDTPGCP